MGFLFFGKKKNKAPIPEPQPQPQPEQPKEPQRYTFWVAGVEDHQGPLRYDLTVYNEDFNERGEDGDFVYKYVSNVDTVQLKETPDGMNVIANEHFLIGFVPPENLPEVRRILSEHLDAEIYCDVQGGEYKEYEGRKAVKGVEPFTAKVMLKY